MITQYNKAVDLIDNDVLYDATVYHYLDNFAPDTWIYTAFEHENILGI